MTGIERLREVVRELGRFSFCYDLYETLCAIADQIEAEQDERITRRLEDREAAEWVREHGGLDSVKKLLDWVVGHCSTRQQLDFDFWLSGRVMHELGFDEDMADRDEVERRLLARLMPEGMEWPRYESGELMQPNDKLLDKDGDWFKAVSFVFTCDWWSVRGYQTEGFGELSDKTRRKLDGMAYGTRVKRPAPKVLDADGVEIYKGRIAYGTRGRKYRVTELCEYEPSIVHAQAIDDGELGDEFIAANTGLNSYQLDASKLTHERPDSWEQLDEDAEKDPCGYFGFDGEETCGKCPASGKNCEQTMARDLVRRAKKLADRGQ